MTIDHVVPRRCGGDHTWTNLVTACEECNRKKGGKLAQEAQMQLIREPFEPPSSPAYLYRRYLEANQDWIDFIRGW
jgi:5-methylcytosine-specific restriction endonuclease McrA